MSDKQKMIRKYLHERLALVFSNGQQRNAVVDVIVADVIIDLYENVGESWTFDDLSASMERVLYSRIVNLV